MSTAGSQRHQGSVTSHEEHCSLTLRDLLAFNHLPQVQVIPDTIKRRWVQLAALLPSLSRPSRGSGLSSPHNPSTAASAEAPTDPSPERRAHGGGKCQVFLLELQLLCACPRSAVGPTEVTEGTRDDEISASLTRTLAFVMSCYALPDLWLFTCSDLPRLLVYLARKRDRSLRRAELSRAFSAGNQNTRN